jgi:hypothetical protein
MGPLQVAPVPPKAAFETISKNVVHPSLMTVDNAKQVDAPAGGFFQRRGGARR